MIITIVLEKNAFSAIALNASLLATLCVCSTMDTIVIYLEGNLETLQKEQKLGKKFL